MDRQFYLDLAASGHCTVVGADLLLHENADPEAIKLDGPRLGRILAQAAERYHSPLAIPLMDLTVEKQAMLEALGIPENQIDDYHFTDAPTDEQIAIVKSTCNGTSTLRMKANCDATSFIAQHHPDLLPIGMCIGPFSLMVKLMEDPIMAVYFTGQGMSAEDEPTVQIAEKCLQIGEIVITQSIRAQVAAGAKAMFLCEPAANVVYLSPHQWDTGIFEHFVMKPNRRIRQLLAELDCDLILHDCGELTNDIVSELASLDPAVMSLGASRKLWEDAALVSKSTVLFGNLPSKQFYSDDQMPATKVQQLARELKQRMIDVGHPFILGSECDVLSVKGSEATIKNKVKTLLGSGSDKGCGCQTARCMH